MRWFKEQGWLVHNASPGLEVGDVDMQYDIEIQRTPFSFKNIKAYFQLKRIIETNHSCSHPNGGCTWTISCS